MNELIEDYSAIAGVEGQGNTKLIVGEDGMLYDVDPGSLEHFDPVTLAAVQKASSSLDEKGVPASMKGAFGKLASIFTGKATGIAFNKRNPAARFENFFINKMGWNGGDVNFAISHDKAQRILELVPKLGYYIFTGQGEHDIESLPVIHAAIREVNSQGNWKKDTVFFLPNGDYLENVVMDGASGSASNPAPNTPGFTSGTSTKSFHTSSMNLANSLTPEESDQDNDENDDTKKIILYTGIGLGVLVLIGILIKLLK